MSNSRPVSPSSSDLEVQSGMSSWPSDAKDSVDGVIDTADGANVLITCSERSRSATPYVSLSPAVVQHSLAGSSKRQTRCHDANATQLA